MTPAISLTGCSMVVVGKVEAEEMGEGGKWMRLETISGLELGLGFSGFFER